jgi:hypothetical protein
VHGAAAFRCRALALIQIRRTLNSLRPFPLVG